MYAEHCIVSHADFAKLAESYNPWTVLGVSNRDYECVRLHVLQYNNVWSILLLFSALGIRAYEV